MKLKNLLVLSGVTAALSFGSGKLQAQQQGGRGNFDPEQMRQRMMERTFLLLRWWSFPLIRNNTFSNNFVHQFDGPKVPLL